MDTNTTALGFHRSVGGYRATTSDYVYDIRQDGRGEWRLLVSHATQVVGITITDPDRPREHTSAETLRLAKAIARNHAADVDADTKRSQNRMTRAITRAYDEEN